MPVAGQWSTMDSNGGDLHDVGLDAGLECASISATLPVTVQTDATTTLRATQRDSESMVCTLR